MTDFSTERTQEKSSSSQDTNLEAAPGSTNNESIDALFSQVQTGLAYLDANLNFLQVNPAFAEAYHLQTGDLYGKNFAGLSASTSDREIIETALATGDQYVDYSHRGPVDGTSGPIFWDWRLRPTRNRLGEVDGLIISIQDVTEAVRQEQAKQQNREMFVRLFESAPDATILLDRNGKIINANQRTEHQFGYTREEIAGKPLEFLLPERFGGRRIATRLLKAMQPRSQPVSIGIDLFGQHKNGYEFPIDMTLSPFDSPEGTLVISVVRDITRRKQAEQALRAQAAYLKLLQNVAVAANEATTVETAIQFALDAICAYTGWPVGHALHPVDAGRLESLELWHLKDPQRYASFRMASESKTYEPGQSLPGDALGGAKPIWWNGPGFPPGYQRAEAATAAGLLGGFAFPVLVAREVVAVLEFFSDEPIQPDDTLVEVMTQVGTQLSRVVERKRSEEELHRSEARFRTIFEESPLGIKLIDLEGRILESNDVLLEMLGYNHTELIGKSFTDFTDPVDVPLNVAQFEALLRGDIDRFKLEKRYIRKDGKLIWGLLNMSLVRGSDGSPHFAIGMVEDITRRKEVESELTEVQRRLMESTENERLRLAQDLHDGPIQELYGANFLLQELHEATTRQPSQETVEKTKTAIQQVISSLRYTCGELRPPTLAPFGLEKAIRSHAEAFQVNHPELDVRLDLMNDGQSLSEHVRLALFRIYQQLLSNVVRHAQATRLDVRLCLDDQNAILEIIDNGQGFTRPSRWISLARQGHLGLVGASERAEAIGGRLEIETEPGKGTLIRTIVPRNAP